MLLLSKSSEVAIDRDQAIKPNLSPVFELQKICLVRSIHIHNLILNSDDFSSYSDRKSDKFAAALLGLLTGRETTVH